MPPAAPLPQQRACVLKGHLGSRDRRCPLSLPVLVPEPGSGELLREYGGARRVRRLRTPRLPSSSGDAQLPPSALIHGVQRAWSKRERFPEERTGLRRLLSGK